jgi:hypothetical protein
MSVGMPPRADICRVLGGRAVRAFVGGLDQPHPLSFVDPCDGGTDGVDGPGTVAVRNHLGKHWLVAEAEPTAELVSMGLIPETATFTRTSPGPGSGSGRSTSLSVDSAGPVSW